MSASTTRKIGGVLLKPDGTPFANSSLTIYRDKRKVVPQGDAAIVDEVLRTVTGPDGEVSMALVPGKYLGQIRLSDADRYFQFTVPDGAGPFVIADLIETSPISVAQYLTLLDLVTTARAWAEKPEDEEVVENGYSALHWASKAADARDDAIAAKNLAEGFKDDAEAAKTASESARDASVVAKGLAEAAQQAAEDARDDALLAQSGAESARDAAVVARGGAESARDAAVVAKNAAEDAQADAEVARLAAENARDAAIQAKNDAEGFKDDAESAASDAQDALSTAQSIYAKMSGGLTGQFLMKQSNDDYDYTWGDVVGGGIMLASIYDPNGVAADAFDMDNMVEGASNKILTAALKNKLDGIEAGAQVNSVTSVAGKTGAVTLSASDISGLGNSATRNVGTTSGTVAAGNDSRITGALQASNIVPQAEAEAGTATTPRAWNAERVRQAIEAISVGRAKAWGKFTSSGLVRGHNIASVSGSGVVTFVTPMPDNNYTILATNVGTDSDTRYANIRSQSASSFQVAVGGGVGTMHVAVFDI